MTATAGLTITRDGSVATLTMHHDFIAAVNQVAGENEIRAVVLASTGKVFSAGGDFEMMRHAHDNPDVRRRLAADARRLLTSLIELPQPIVAAVQGAAVGLGATVVLSCDAVVASRNAKIADSHVNVGLVAGDGGAVVWPAIAGVLRAKRHLLTGDPLDAETAFTLGLVTDLVDEPDQVLPAATVLATRIAGLPPLAVQLTKRAINRGLLQRAGEVLELSLAYEETTLASDDLLEGIEALQERRPGDFTGR